MRANLLGQLPLLRSLVPVAAFALAFTLQSFFPFSPRKTGLFLNWRANLSLGALGWLVIWLSRLGALWQVAERAQSQNWGLLPRLGLSSVANVVVGVILLDGLTYLLHRIYHHVPWLWRLHAVHHIDETVEVTTAVRFHPLELLISSGIRVVVVWFLGISVTGVLIFEALFAFSNFLQHANLRLSQAANQKLGWILVTPQLHRIHHLRDSQSQQSNFSTIFSGWDRLAGTLRTSGEDGPIGLEGAPTRAGFLWLLGFPFHRR